MSMIAERPRSAANEPDRLQGFASPREVDRVYGHAGALAEFADALASGRLHHAWLIAGPEGVGKATLAYHFARTALAGGPVVDADHPVFRKVAGLGHPNLLLLRRALNERTRRYSQYIGVDEVRRLKAFLGNTAGEGAAWRVVIVDRADELNQNAANALLKALEEPPPRTLFLLVAGAEGRLPVTVRSRTRVLRVGALGAEDLEHAVRSALEREDYQVEDDTLPTALALAQGSVRRALELIGGDGIALYEEIAATAGMLPDLDPIGLHKTAERLSPPGETERLELYLSLLLGLIERLVRYGATDEGAVSQEQRLAARLVSERNLAAWAEAWEAIARAREDAFALNLDRSLLVMDTWLSLQKLAREYPV
jgi:DNA polymerase-3 subunit delta'